MRVALVHDYLNQYGGAERVLECLAEMFPDAPIYTLLHSPEKTLEKFTGRVRQTSFLDYPFVHRNHRLFIPLMPLAAGRMNLGAEYDLIISSSASFGKGIRYEKSVHICYCHTPLRYAWEEDYLGSLFALPLRLLAKPILRYLRSWDKHVAQKPDIIIANSEYIRGKIKKCFGRDAAVVYPPVSLEEFYPDPGVSERSYFLAAGRFLHYKRFDLVINAFNDMPLPLKIVGSGPELHAMRKRIRSPHIELVPFVKTNAELRRIYSGAKALIFPQVEDFGLAAAEAIACGTPVIAYNAGGAKEIVMPGVNGALFDSQSPEAIQFVIERFPSLKFDHKEVAKTAERFGRERFKQAILELVTHLVKHRGIENPESMLI
jgi:glycosyltransferase involved in cell wall biosynthesis